MGMDPATNRMIRRAQAVDFDLAQRTAPGIIAAALRYDPRIRIYWDRTIERFCIAREGEVQWHFIAVWQDENGGFLPLDRRILEALAAWDMHKPWDASAPRTADELASKMDAEDNARDEKSKADFADDIAHIGLDNRRQIQKAIKQDFNIH